MRLSVVLAAAWIALGTARSATNSASMSGTVQDDSGNVVAGVTVEAHLIRQLTTGQFGRVVSEGPAFSGTSTTDSSGRFALTSLPAGGYFVCAYPISVGYLSNCEWNTTAQRTDVPDGAQVAGLTLVLRKGTVVQIVANDPLSLVSPPTGLVAVPSGHRFFPSVRDPKGYFGVARLATSTAVQHIYNVTIPNTATVELFLDSDVSVIDSAGHTLPVRIPSGITVTGGAGMVTITVVLSN